MKAIRVLLDTNIQQLRSSHTLVRTLHRERKDGRVTTWTEEKPMPRRLPGKTQKQSNSIYESLKEISKMAMVGLVALYQSDETLAEFINLRPSGASLSQFDVFRGVKISHVRAPLIRGFVIDSSYSPSRARDDWHVFLEQIQHPRYLQLLKHTSGAHKADLYHLWEAEYNEMEVFVTLDAKFVNAVTLPKPLKTTVKICTPSQFLEWVSQLRSAV